MAGEWARGSAQWKRLASWSGCVGAQVGFYVVLQVSHGLTDSFVAALDAPDQDGAFESSDDVVGSGGNVHVLADGSGGDAFDEQIAEHRLPVMKRFAHTDAQHRVAIVGVDGGVEQRASAGEAGAGGEVGDVLPEPVGLVGDGGEAATALFDGCRPGVVEGFGGEFFLALEVPVDAAFFKAGGGHDGLEGATLVTALVEDGRGLGDDALAGQFALRHTCLSLPEKTVRSLHISTFEIRRDSAVILSEPVLADG